MNEICVTPADNAVGAWPSRILRVGLVGCFLGHGAFGVMTKAGWIPYFGVVGISESAGWQLMPLIGTMDITVGFLVLVWPCRALFAWATMWALWTALCRPLSGESVWEFFERAGNYGVPFALLATAGWRGLWFSRLPDNSADSSAAIRRCFSWSLRATTVALLMGHAALGLFLQKPTFARHYGVFYSGSPTALVPWIGGFEFVLAALVLVFPRSGLLFFVCAWKISTEMLFPLSGAPIWELIERFGSYAAPLALALLLRTNAAHSSPRCSILLAARPRALEATTSVCAWSASLATSGRSPRSGVDVAAPRQRQAETAAL